MAQSAAKVGALIGEITATSKEQSTGIEQLNRAVTEMDEVVQRNAANAEDSASAAEEMNAQAEEMKTHVIALAKLIGDIHTKETRTALITHD